MLDANNREDSWGQVGVRHTPPPRKGPVAVQPGMVIDGRWVVEQLIARGAMGEVWLAKQSSLDRRVAVKLLDPESTADDPKILVERFYREASVLARLQHGNVVRVLDLGTWQGRLFLVMEYVDGWSLKRLQAGGPLPAARAVHIASQIVDALHEAHTLGLIHRDLKPANVLLTRTPGALDVVKVVDFGLAKDCFVVSDLTVQGQVLGTPMFMAPEQIRDEPCDGRADLYAVGVLLYGCLAGRHPYDLGGATEVMLAHLEREIPRFAEAAPDLRLPPIVEWTVRTCLEKDREQRFANAQELKKALTACAEALAHPEAPAVTGRLVQGRFVAERAPAVAQAGPSGPLASATLPVLGGVIAVAFSLGALIGVAL